MYLEAEICDPTGAVLHIADSETSDFFGGDSLADPDGDGTPTEPTCHDAEVYLNGTTVEAWADDEGRAQLFQPAFSTPQAVSASGCSSLSLTVEQTSIELHPSRGRFASPNGFSLSPPACVNGQNGQLDRLWHLGVNSTVSRRADRVGTGLQRLFLCLR